MADEEAPLRVAMWSGPRSLSTAMMRSWGSRADTAVVDEPLYAFYLSHRRLGHPGREQVLACQPTDWRRVVSTLTSGPLPAGARIGYQKHMAHHLLDEVERAALAPLRHAHLVRHPARVVASYARVRDRPSVADLGLPQQVEPHERFGGPVLDADDVLRRPGRALALLCAALGVAWDPAMLAWAPGPRDSDGVWAPHWYRSVWDSTGFGPPAGPLPEPPAHLAGVVEDCLPFYERLRAERLRID